jgi:23S rRNA (guanosine2251-2'-O)-methyltransferase
MKKLLHGEILSERLTNDQALIAQRHPVSLFLDNIRSLYNVGSIFRTADSALAEEIILTGFTPAPPRDEIFKTALGAVDSVPWKYFKDPIDGILYLRDKGVKILALELTDKKRFYDSIKPEEFPICLVLGNELTGIDDKLLKYCDDSVEIQMYGVKHSLNVSVAAGIALFEAVKLWNSYNI